MNKISTQSPALLVATRIDGRGLASAATAFLIWGLLPLYLMQLQSVPVWQITAHRLVWGCLLGLVWLALRGQLAQVRAALADPKIRLRLCLSASLITLNWAIYIWAIANHHVVEGSLGYFINPLVNVLLGVLLLAERLNRTQWTAVVFAAAGVSFLTWSTGHPPWIALALAFTFGIYGLVRKVVQVDALAGFASETLLLMPFGIAYLLWCELQGVSVFGHRDGRLDLLLALSGPATAIPLVLFAFGARRIPYSTVGLLQYIGPTIQLLLAVWVFKEPFGGPRIFGFAMIWTALAIYAIDGVWRNRKLN